MQFQMSLFNATGLELTFLYSLIILISSVFKKNRTLLFPPFITMCVMVTALQLTAFLEWLWMPGVYPRLLFRFLFVLEYVLSFASLLVIVGILWGLVHVAFRHAERTEALVTSDCP